MKEWVLFVLIKDELSNADKTKVKKALKLKPENLKLLTKNRSTKSFNLNNSQEIFFKKIQ
jgi:hypothetical protein